MILVVEDEDLISMVVIEELNAAGYAAMPASNADDAIKIIQSRIDIKILFTDIDMPGSFNGLRLAAIVRDRWPAIRIIVTSGGSHQNVNYMPPGSVFLTKPYKVSQILATIRSFSNDMSEFGAERMECHGVTHGDHGSAPT